MTGDYEIKRVEYEGAPNRCQAVGPQGQCMNEAVPGGTNCPVHGGAAQVDSKQRTSLRNYRLDKWSAKMRSDLAAKCDGDHVKSLRDEIAILRICLEERLNVANTPLDLLLHSQAIADTVMKVERLVTSCHKLEGSMGQMLDKSAILQFASEVIDIVGGVIKDEDDLNKVANQILQAVGRLGTVDEEK